jgi:hypothetical protein
MGTRQSLGFSILPAALLFYLASAKKLRPSFWQGALLDAPCTPDFFGFYAKDELQYRVDSMPRG